MKKTIEFISNAMKYYIKQIRISKLKKQFDKIGKMK